MSSLASQECTALSIGKSKGVQLAKQECTALSIRESKGVQLANSADPSQRVRGQRSIGQLANLANPASKSLSMGWI